MDNNAKNGGDNNNDNGRRQHQNPDDNPWTQHHAIFLMNFLPLSTNLVGQPFLHRICDISSSDLTRKNTDNINLDLNHFVAQIIRAIFPSKFSETNNIYAYEKFKRNINNSNQVHCLYLFLIIFFTGR